VASQVLYSTLTDWEAQGNYCTDMFEKAGRNKYLPGYLFNNVSDFIWRCFKLGKSRLYGKAHL